MENNEVIYFTNPQGVYNKYTGTWDVPEGRFRNGRYWQPNRRVQQTRTELDQHSGGKRGSGAGASRVKVRLTTAAEDSDDGEAAEDQPPFPRPKRRKVAVRKVTSEEQPMKAGDPSSNHSGPRVGQWPTMNLKRFACGQAGHFAIFNSYLISLR
ncbi:hypothetical protein PF005_g525 [Phytophthora fragariae]|uniref:Uncharacterized protein n=1 Tax=Phytophthora fragariae TaxID=53985 RepID=A0A6A3FYI3_9STRA|nr:hypothetical protein PF003_g10012 [Phytophthora fragariae]KAE8949933.1 hypothetical protein PF009_g531 [Phytophthora fragariae]KAE9139758.1 hypothetical protein PF010_g483 [Phytophthora fragariae]KAE9140766.1 hypothetical protein PF007_g534 [Phytophthora fragariae]KAE9237770.1 hypothetical protein PF005_g525 [Phytophthora fragariae]